MKDKKRQYRSRQGRSDKQYENTSKILLVTIATGFTAMITLLLYSVITQAFN